MSVGASSSVLEAVDVAQRREHERTTRRRRRASARRRATTAGPTPISAPATPDSNAPSSLEAPMKTFSTAITRPRMSVGRGQRDDRRPDEHADRVGAGQHDAGRRTPRRSCWVTPSTIVATPNTATATNSVRPTCRRTGRTASSAVTITAPMPGRRPQPAVADAADAEAVLGDRRQQGDGAAEQHGEHVEGDGAEQDRSAADEAQALHARGAASAARSTGVRSWRWRSRQRRGDRRAAVPKHTAATMYGHGRVDGVEEPARRPARRSARTARCPSTAPSAGAARRSGAISGGRERNDGAAKARAVPNSSGDAEDRERRRRVASRRSRQ